MVSQAAANASAPTILLAPAMRWANWVTWAASSAATACLRPAESSSQVRRKAARTSLHHRRVAAAFRREQRLVDRAGGGGGVRAEPAGAAGGGGDLGKRQPTVELVGQLRQFDRLDQEVVHAGGEARLGLSLQRIRGAGDDRHARAPGLGFQLADAARQLVAVHVGHVAVGDDQAEAARLPHLQGLDAVVGGLGGVAQGSHLAQQQHAVDGVVVHQQHQRAVRLGLRGVGRDAAHGDGRRQRTLAVGAAPAGLGHGQRQLQGDRRAASPARFPG